MTGIYHPDTRQSSHQPSWKAYQQRLKQGQRIPTANRRKVQHSHSGLKVQRSRSGLKIAGLLIVLFVVAWGVFRFPKGKAEPPSASVPIPVIPAATLPIAAPATDTEPAPPAPTATLSDRIQKSDVRILLGQNHLTNVAREPVPVVFDGRPYAVHTSLDIGLQQYLLDKLDRVNSRYIGIVAMQPKTGRLIAMVGFDKQHPENDPCVIADYPAASIFKIITAAAAVEKKGYTNGTCLTFSGSKHTLYKRQLAETAKRYTSSISLKDAFAQSINPVFGKIGAFYLDPSVLTAVGDAFAFNRQVDFDLPWPTSHLEIDDDTYHRAEIASGFNRETTISPLHGAVIVSTVLNDGRPVEPALVDRIVDDAGKTVYHSEPCFLPQAVSATTAAELEQMMKATITSGTGRRAFRGHGQSKILSRLNLGGKTGSISNQANDTRFDWFTGFATEKSGSEKIVVAVMVGHGKLIGTRAGQYARMAIEYYFKDHFTKKEPAGNATNG